VYDAQDQRKNEKTMPLNETTIIVRQDAAKADVTKLTEEFAKIITDEKGKIEKNEYWGLRNLAYPINKNKKGHYTFFAIDADAAPVKEMERTLRMAENIIRYMTIPVDECVDTPGSVFQGSSSYEENAA